MRLTETIKGSLKWKFVLTITAVIICMASSIAYFSYLETSRTIRADVEYFGNQVMGQANLNLGRYFREYEQGFLLIGGSEEFSQWLKVAPGDLYHTVNYYRQLESRYMTPFANQHPEILSISLFSSNGQENHFRSTQHEFFLDNGYSIVHEPWFGKLGFSNEIIKIVKPTNVYTSSNGNPLQMRVMQLIKEFRVNNIQGYIKMDISLRPAQEILNEIRLGNRHIGFIIDQQGKVMVHSDPAQAVEQLDADLVVQMQEGKEAFFRKSTNDLVVTQSIPNSLWKIVVVVPYEEVAKSIFKVRDITILISFASLLAAIILVIVVSSSITKRLKQLRATIGATEVGRFDIGVNIEGKDEVSELGRAYNKMLDRLDTTVHQLAKAKVSQQEAILSALQSQIDSHFLYNTLEFINSMAYLSNHREIENTSVALSRMLRYTSNYKDTIVALQDEIDHLENYLHIIKLQYDRDVMFTIQVADECKKVPCLKAIIQPIVENSIKHGFEATGESLGLEIIAESWEERYIRIRILDNAAGFPEQKLRELTHKLNMDDPDHQYKHLTRIGLLNVNYRLRMFYPDGISGVAIGNREDRTGACVQIIFSKQRQD